MANSKNSNYIYMTTQSYMIYKESDLKREIEIKTASLETLDYQIKTLKDLTNPTQVLIWRRNRRKLFQSIKELKIRYDLIKK